MATKQNLFDKIGDLLQELNAQYLELSNNGFENKKTDLALLEATAQYIAAQAGVLKAQDLLDKGNQLAREDELAAPKVSIHREEEEKLSFNNYFTPPSNLFQGRQTKEEQASPIATPVEKEIHTPIQPVVLQEESDTKPIADNLPKPTPVEVVKEEVVVDLPVSAEKEVEQPVQQAPIQPEVEEAAVIINEVIEEPKEIVIVEEILPVTPVQEEAPARPLTLNEIISQQKKAGVQNRVYEMNAAAGAPAQVKDIKAIINLNDKLLFIKDLFNGYSLAYSEAVELLNRCNDYAEADAFLQTNYAVKNRWVEKPQSVEKLYALLRKRFA